VGVIGKYNVQQLNEVAIVFANLEAFEGENVTRL
jgi:hypothetical protein